MKKLITLVALLLCFQAVQAQVKIDVKTTFAAKEQFSIYKAGIMQMLEQSTLFQVVDTGEDYSLWIKGFTAYTKYDGERHVSAQIELRTPAFFTHGKLIASVTVRDKYNPDVFSDAGNVQDLAKRMASMRKLKQLATKLSMKTNKAVAGYATASTGIPILPIYQSLISKVNTSFGQRPTALDLSDSIYLGGLVAEYLYGMTYR